MNQLDPRLETQPPARVLDSNTLSAWSADGFALARRLARAPVTITGGFANTRLTLGLRAPDGEPPALGAPLLLDETRVTLALGPAALDALAARLGSDQGEGSGATLSLDAVEAILAGLLAPLTLAGIGRAREASDQDRQAASIAIAALQVEAATIAVLGSDAALAVLLEAMHAKADRLVAAPLSYLRAPSRTQLAVTVETLFGLVSLNAAERAALEPGGGLYLDTLWPDGRTVVGRQFVALESGWAREYALAGDALALRGGLAIRSLEDPDLAAPLPAGESLELVDGDRVIASGRLETVRTDAGVRPILVLERIGWPSEAVWPPCA